MKKTTPAIIATFLTSLVLGGSMLMIGLDASRTASTTTAAAVAATPQAIVNIYTNPTKTGTTTVQAATTNITITKTTTNTRPVLRTAGS